MFTIFWRLFVLICPHWEKTHKQFSTKCTFSKKQKPTLNTRYKPGSSIHSWKFQLVVAEAWLFTWTKALGHAHLFLRIFIFPSKMYIFSTHPSIWHWCFKFSWVRSTLCLLKKFTNLIKKSSRLENFLFRVMISAGTLQRKANVVFQIEKTKTKTKTKTHLNACICSGFHISKIDQKYHASANLSRNNSMLFP